MNSHWTLTKNRSKMRNKFIGIDEKTIPPFKSTSLLLRRSFNVRNIKHTFILQVIGLGIAVYYINGQKITDNVLCTPSSDYSKSLNYEEYDVSKYLRRGKNVIAIELGNGFYNESLETVWKFNNCHWRGPKCLYLKLKADNRLILQSDEKFKVLYSPYLTYNELRGGERLDQRKFIDFASLSYDDSNWEFAVTINNPPKGRIRKNICPPIKEFETRDPINVFKNKNGYIFDFGKNMSGYVRAEIFNHANQEIIFKYAEDITEGGELNLHNLNCYQKDEPFQTDSCIADGSHFFFTPKFTYHGFRYVEVSGVDNLDDISLKAIFIHQDIKFIKPKTPIGDKYNKIFEAGINSILSNTYYGFTDCPTREKLNWLNDLSASLPVIMKYFDCKDMLTKIYQDIIDSQNNEGNIPGIAPSPKWGYEYGPVCNGIAIMLPYLLYKQYGDRSLFDNNISHIKKYYRFVKKNLNTHYFFLGDWTGATNHPKTPIEFVLDTYMYLFDKWLFEMTDNQSYQKDLLLRKKRLTSYEVLGQTIPSILLCLGLGDKKKNLEVLVNDIKSLGYHFDVGMFGVQFLFKALSENNLDDIIYNIVCNKKAPSFQAWIDEGATTFYETFGETWSLSMNHHMFSNVLLYLK